MSRDSARSLVGEGSYGVVISVEDTTNGSMYAIKKIQDALSNIGNGFRVYREIQIMRHWCHDNVLKLVDFSVHPSKTSFSDLYLRCRAADP